MNSDNFEHILQSLEVCNYFFESRFAENVRGLPELPLDLAAGALDLHELDQLHDIGTLPLIFSYLLPESDLITDLV